MAIKTRIGRIFFKKRAENISKRIPYFQKSASLKKKWRHLIEKGNE